MVHFISHLAPILILIEKAILALLVFLLVAILAIFIGRLRSYSRIGGDASSGLPA